MPNWCSNILTITSTSPEFIKQLKAAAEAERLFNFVSPMPEALANTTKGYYGKDTEKQAELDALQDQNMEQYGYPTWYEFALAEWGTKWEIGDVAITACEDDRITLVFTTAWSPPLGIYDALDDTPEVESIYATWHEPGMAFMGQFKDGAVLDIEVGEYTEDWLYDNVPASLAETYVDEFRNIQEMNEEWEREFGEA